VGEEKEREEEEKEREEEEKEREGEEKEREGERNKKRVKWRGRVFVCCAKCSEEDVKYGGTKNTSPV
jgi:hypothetical protein